VEGALTREQLVLRLAEVSHQTYNRQALRDKKKTPDVTHHDLERAEDAVQELERLGIWPPRR
jgi:hypothetical protein